MDPHSKQWHLVDYIIIGIKDRQNMLVTKAMCDADCWTDHRLIISKTKLHIQSMRRPQGQIVSKRLNTNKLELTTTLESQLNKVSGNDWDSLKMTVHFTALQVLGLTTETIKTGLMRMMLKSRPSWKKSVNPTEPTRVTPPPNRRKMPTSASAEKCRESYASCKIPGSATRPM